MFRFMQGLGVEGRRQKKANEKVKGGRKFTKQPFSNFKHLEVYPINWKAEGKRRLI